jgi:hypothetical protein
MKEVIDRGWDIKARPARTKPLPHFPEPKANKVHWDHLLEAGPGGYCSIPRHVMRSTLNPRVLIQLTPCDAASDVHHTLAGGNEVAGR